MEADSDQQQNEIEEEENREVEYAGASARDYGARVLAGPRGNCRRFQLTALNLFFVQTSRMCLIGTNPTTRLSALAPR